MPQKYFLTVDWCNKGKRGIFTDTNGNAYWKENEPHTKDEMFEVLGVFDLVLSPESILFTEEEIKQYRWFIPLAEYSDCFGYVLRDDQYKEG